MKRFVSAAVMGCFLFLSPAFAAEFSADLTTEMVGMTMPGKIYFKDAKTSRTEMSMMSMTVITIIKHPAAYMLYPATNKYVVTDLEEMKTQSPLAGVDDLDAWLLKNNFRKTGAEKLQGFECLIYEGNIDTDSAGEGMPASIPLKLWYSRELGCPIRTESAVGPMGMMTTALENITMGSQPATLFGIPPGYTEAQSPQEAMGAGMMGGFGQAAPSR